MSQVRGQLYCRSNRERVTRVINSITNDQIDLLLNNSRARAVLFLKLTSQQYYSSATNGKSEQRKTTNRATDNPTRDELCQA